MPISVARLFAVSAVLTIAAGCIPWSLSDGALDIHFHDTYFIIAHSHVMILTGLLLGIFAAVYYGYPGSSDAI